MVIRGKSKWNAPQIAMAQLMDSTVMLREAKGLSHWLSRCFAAAQHDSAALQSASTEGWMIVCIYIIWPLFCILEQIRYDSRPACLMAGANPATSISMEVFMEWDMISPVWIVLESHIRAKYSPVTLLVA